MALNNAQENLRKSRCTTHWSGHQPATLCLAPLHDTEDLTSVTTLPETPVLKVGCLNRYYEVEVNDMSCKTKHKHAASATCASGLRLVTYITQHNFSLF